MAPTPQTQGLPWGSWATDGIPPTMSKLVVKHFVINGIPLCLLWLLVNNLQMCSRKHLVPAVMKSCLIIISISVALQNLPSVSHMLPQLTLTTVLWNRYGLNY